MAFSLSGTTITQTGTDDTASTISGLSAITGVTTIVNENYTRIIIPYKLNITGVMTNNAGVAFTFSRLGTFANEVVVSGSWTYKHSRNENGFDDYYTLPSMVFTQNQIAGWNGTGRNAIYSNGGAIDFAKLEIVADGGQYWNGGSLVLRQVVFNAQNLLSTADTQFTTQAGSPNIDIIGLKVIGGRVFFRGAVIVNFSGFEPVYMQRGFGTQDDGLVVENFAPGQGNLADVSVWAGGDYEYRNASIGSDLSYERWIPTGGFGTIFVSSDMTITCFDENNNPVNNFKTYYTDNVTNAPTGFTAQNTYNGVSSGNTLSQRVILGALSQPNSGTVPSGISFVKRSASQTNDVYSFPLASYAHEITIAFNLDLKGVGVNAYTQIMLTDVLISQNDKAIVNAYPVAVNLSGGTLTLTGDSNTLQSITAQQFYDAVKAYLIDNYNGETETIVSRSSNTVNARALNVVLDYITMTGGLETTGTVTLTNGSTVSGGVIDATANSFLSFSSIVSWRVYSTEADRDADASALATGTVSETYRFNFVANTTYYLRLYTSATTFIGDATTPAQAGETSISLDTPSLLSILSGDIKLARDNALAANVQTKMA